MGFKTSIVVESLISTIIQFGVFFLILYFEGMDMYSDIIAVVVMFAYMGVVMLFCHGSKGATDVWSILEGANKRRLGFDILFLIAFTLIPIRAINIIALTIAVDAIITLLPGKAICYGKKLWEFSKVAYILALVTTVSFLLVNLLKIPFWEIYNAMTLISGGITIIAAIFIVIVIIVGLLGRKL